MRIRLFSSYIDNTALPHELKDCNLVVDAQNFLYDCYKESGLRFEFGAECDRYAKYLKDYLRMFKVANVKCYFIFKGGTKELKGKINNIKNNADKSSSIDPMFMTDIHLQVLREMEFENICFSEYDCKSDCIALACKLSCPVLSMDIEFALSGVQYIPKLTLRLGENKTLTCKLFSLDNFCQVYKLNRNKVAIFILLTDEKIFPERSFDGFFKLRRIPTSYSPRNKMLLRFLSNASENQVIKDILKTTTFGKDMISEKLNKLMKHVRGEICGGMTVDYLLYRQEITDWFVSGVALQNIAKPYVDLYRSNVLFISVDNCVFMNPSLNIIKYAYDLLTGFRNDGLKFICFLRQSNTYQSKVIKDSVQKPTCQTDLTVFENGWDNIRSLALFQHFLKEEINFDCDELEEVPDDVKMLMITLAYTIRKSNTFTTDMAYGILLSYVMLSVVKEIIDNTDNDNSITISDCELALHSLEDFFNVDEVNHIMHNNILNPLMEFQCCLLHMNYLNKLCGSPYEETIYRNTYNGTFVYKFIYSMQNDDAINFANRMFLSAPTVHQYFNHIIDLYKKLVE